MCVGTVWVRADIQAPQLEQILVCRRTSPSPSMFISIVSREGLQGKDLLRFCWELSWWSSSTSTLNKCGGRNPRSVSSSVMHAASSIYVAWRGTKGVKGEMVV